MHASCAEKKHPAPISHQPTNFARVKAICLFCERRSVLQFKRSCTGGRQGRDWAAFKRLVLRLAAASSARKGADCSTTVKGVSRCSLLRKPAVVRCSARRAGTSLAQAASQRQPHVTCHMSRITRQPSPVASKTAFICVAACAWWRVALKRVSAAAHQNYQPSTPLSLHSGGDSHCPPSYLFYMRFRCRI